MEYNHNFPIVPSAIEIQPKHIRAVGPAANYLALGVGIGIGIGLIASFRERSNK